MNVSNEHPQFKFNGKIMKMYPRVIKYSLTTPRIKNFSFFFFLIRAYIKATSQIGCSLKQIFVDISVVYRSTTVSYDMVCRRKKKFYSGSIKNAPKLGRPKSAS